MADFNVMQPNNLDAMPVSRPQGSMVSSDAKQVDKGQIAQEIVQKKVDISQLKSQEAKDQIQSEDLDSLMKNLNRQLEALQNYLRFEKDEDSDRMVIFIKNSETDEVIRQIPSQEFLTISKNITNYLDMRQQLSETIDFPLGMITHEKA
ncbi:MAG: flagellar protein FlaG [Pseudomonadota bacterium]|nr:flagellar protein FlaG [Pseudomonadota bacterium]